MKNQESINVTYIENETVTDKQLWVKAPKLDVACKLNFNSPNLNYPVKVFFTTKSGIIIWSTTISHHNTWCSLPSSRGLDVRVIDNNGNLILNRIWDENIYSDICELKFLEWCRFFISQKNKKPKGIVIGSHNGLTGEWVSANNKDLIGSTMLIEPNEKPFQQLITKYQNDTKFTFKNFLVSETGGLVNFYTNENEDSETSSILNHHFEKWYSKVITKKVFSKTIDELLIEFSPDWLHIDVEGLDAKLLLSASDNLLSKVKFIIWEDMHLSDEETELLTNKLKNINFNIFVGYEYNSFAIKN
jgi:FkbM family methyltransferase